LVNGNAGKKYNTYLEKQKAVTAQKKKEKRSQRLTRSHCWLVWIAMLKRLKMVIR